MSKKKSKHAVAAHRFAIAELMASRWDDDYLTARTTEDVMRAYGLSLEQAVRLLDNEKRRRTKA